ncbi:rCG41074 [Rattus norvegicus]|uniref:RCG41074 n=1 Tax=Rattus norvegicus TaxID=10116 RepID=A6K230_RAT|nr:rCG41074 [Rattus norvegicus]
MDLLKADVIQSSQCDCCPSSGSANWSGTIRKCSLVGVDVLLWVWT